MRLHHEIREGQRDSQFDCQFTLFGLNLNIKPGGLMKHLLPILLLSFILAGCGVNKARIARIDMILDSLRGEYAQDPRTSVFKVSAEIQDEGIVLRGEVDDPDAKAKLFSDIHAAGENTLTDSVTVLPESGLEPKVYGVVDVSVGNLYAGPHDAAELVDQVLLGHTVKVYKKTRDWFYVKSTPELPWDKGYLGWIDTGNIVLMDSSAIASYRAKRKIIVTTILTTLRSMPNGGSTISDLAMADYLTPIRTTSSSFKIELPDGRTGYVSKSDAQFEDEYLNSHKATPQSIEKLAKDFLGFPYLWGGTSTKAMDCSGFVKTVFRMNGIDLPRDASQQSDIGDSVDPGVDFSNLEKGDLLFFGDKATAQKPEKIAHVGIYLGSGFFIHSSSRVRISSFNKNDSLFDKYDLERFVRARRILGVQPNQGKHD